MRCAQTARISVCVCVCLCFCESDRRCLCQYVYADYARGALFEIAVAHACTRFCSFLGVFMLVDGWKNAVILCRIW